MQASEIFSAIHCCVTLFLKSSTKIFYLLCCLLFTSGISSSLFSFQGADLWSRLKPDTSIQPFEHLYLSSIGGDNRIRTDDPLLAKQVLSQLSYTPEKRWWAQVDSNHRPHDYQSCALASWAMGPWRVPSKLNNVKGISCTQKPDLRILQILIQYLRSP